MAMAELWVSGGVHASDVVTDFSMADGDKRVLDVSVFAPFAQPPTSSGW
jgi:hypothetical protein